jgi:hypothetical protein
MKTHSIQSSQIPRQKEHTKHCTSKTKMENPEGHQKITPPTDENISRLR